MALNHATAQACEVDADCGAGYVCEAYDDKICTSQRCDPGEVCPPPDCETYHISYCANALCTADSDCPDTMLCHAESVTVCEDSASESCPDDGTPCEPAPNPASCRSELAPARCQPPYELPCTNDADCGGGFRCTDQRARWCDGSGPVAATDGGVVTPPPAPECGEESTGVSYCALLELPCASDSECPAGLGCFDNPARVICRRPPGAFGFVLDAGVGTANAGTPPSSSGGSVDGVPPTRVPSPTGSDIICEEVPGAPAKLCTPPRWAEGRTVPGVSGGGDTGTNDTGEDDVDPTDDESVDPADDESVDPADDESVEPPSSSDKPRRGRHLSWLRRALREGRGCAVAPAEHEAGFELSWLLLAGALTVRAATRRRR